MDNKKKPTVNTSVPPNHQIKPVDEDSKKKEPPKILKVVTRDQDDSHSRRNFLKKFSTTAATIIGGATVASMATGCGRKRRYGNKDISKREKQMGKSTLTIPCHEPLPPGAVCICDCVASSHTYPGTETVCTCNTVCTCDTVSTRVCTCDTVCTCNTQGSSRTTSYWYPN